VTLFRRAMVLVFALSAFVAACGDDDAATTTTPTTSAPTTTVASTTTTSTVPATTSTTTPETDLGSFIRYESGEYRFQISYPEDWEIDSDSAGIAVQLFSPTPADDDFSENVNVIVEELLEPITLDDYVALALEQVEELFPEFQLFDEFSSTLGGLPAWTVAYTGEIDGVVYGVVQTITIHEDRAFVVTYTGTTEFDRYLPHSDAIFNSISFGE